MSESVVVEQITHLIQEAEIDGVWFYKTCSIITNSNGPRPVPSSDEATDLFTEFINTITSAFEQQSKSTTILITGGLHLLGTNHCTYLYLQLAFFVGGLSTHDWVWSQLHLYFKDRKIDIHRPDIDMCVLDQHLQVFLTHFWQQGSHSWSSVKSHQQTNLFRPQSQQTAALCGSLHSLCWKSWYSHSDLFLLLP